MLLVFTTKEEQIYKTDWDSEFHNRKCFAYPIPDENALNNKIQDKNWVWTVQWRNKLQQVEIWYLKPELFFIILMNKTYNNLF